jgi:hypothetical protein
MTTVPWSIGDKIYYFVICPIHDFLFPKSIAEREREMQKEMLKLLARDHPFVTVGGTNNPKYQNNRKRDGVEYGRP